MDYSPKIEALLTLAEKPYAEYNATLPVIKAKIRTWDLVGDQRVETFERVLGEELPENTARRAYRIAILVALGEPIRRDPKFEKIQGPVKKTENGRVARRA